MSAHDVERERFQAVMESEGMPREISRRILRHAQTIQRLAELECSSEAADRDQVLCPAWEKDDVRLPCLCRDYGSYDASKPDGHGTVPRYMVQSAQAERLIREWCRRAEDAPAVPSWAALSAPIHFEPVFSGDPRGACVKLKVPSGRTDDNAREGVCVPVR